MAHQLTHFCELVDQLFRQTARRHRLRPSDLRCLAALREDREVPVSRLAVRLGLSRSRVSRILDRLEEHRLLRRAIDPVDRRGVNVHATVRGQKLLEEFYNGMLPVANGGENRDAESLNHLVEQVSQALARNLNQVGASSSDPLEEARG